MIGYVLVGSNNIAKAAAFYDSLLADLGAKRMMESEKFVAWHLPEAPQMAGFGITMPFDGNAATVGNGVMVAFAAKNQDQVKALHAKVLAAGGKDEGAPGPRGEGGFYAGYARDLDGNKISFFCMS